MKVAVLGTGIVGQTLATALARLGHEVVVGTRSVDVSLARLDPDAMGNPGFGSWSLQHPEIDVAAFDEAARGADLVICALSGRAVLEDVHAARLAPDTVLLDASNPLDFSGGELVLFVANSDSLAEQLQRSLPDVRVVKALNTMPARLMVDPHLVADGQFSTFVAGDHAGAKRKVIDLLTALGQVDIIDVGGLSAARGTEALLLLWVRLVPVFGGPLFTFKIVR